MAASSRGGGRGGRGTVGGRGRSASEGGGSIDPELRKAQEKEIKKFAQHGIIDDEEEQELLRKKGDLQNDIAKIEKELRDAAMDPIVNPTEAEKAELEAEAEEDDEDGDGVWDADWVEKFEEKLINSSTRNDPPANSKTLRIQMPLGKWITVSLANQAQLDALLDRTSSLGLSDEVHSTEEDESEHIIVDFDILKHRMTARFVVMDVDDFYSPPEDDDLYDPAEDDFIDAEDVFDPEDNGFDPDFDDNVITQHPKRGKPAKKLK